MTYFNFLFRFLVVPIVLLAGLHLWDRRKRLRPATVNAENRDWFAIVILVVVAVVYTTPWDNYLVAKGVWYYNPDLVTGILLGYVPLEEYTFFILQTVLIGLWWWFLARRIRSKSSFTPSRKLRFWSVLVLTAVWLFWVIVLFSGWKPGTYLSIILVWAMPPLIIQSAFGADILWHYRKLVAACALPAVLFLSFADTFAIEATTWTIDPSQSTGQMVGRLPLEEGVFFFATVLIITFGMTLMRAGEIRNRFQLRTR